MPNRGRLLLIEDDKDTQGAMFLALSDAGYSVLPADDGAQAVDFLSRGIQPRLVILDMLLPRVDGWSVLKHLESDKQLRELPIIVITPVRPEQREVKGVDVVLRKPVAPDRLVTEVGRLLGHHP